MSRITRLAARLKLSRPAESLKYCFLPSVGLHLLRPLALETRVSLNSSAFDFPREVGRHGDLSAAYPATDTSVHALVKFSATFPLGSDFF